MKLKKQNKPAFTLIELLVVIAIIGLLATLSVVALNNARARARDSRRASDIKQIHTALELYFNANHEYPNNLEDLETALLMNPVPTAPTPADGSCKNADNIYTYTKIDDKDYVLSYCLGNDTGGLSAGISYASPLYLQVGGGAGINIVAFTDVGTHTWTVPEGVTEVDVLVVAGGGGGGSRNSTCNSAHYGSGGGGGGGIIYETIQISSNEYSVVVGEGGIGSPAGGPTNSNDAQNGGNSSAFGLTAIGGGAGGSGRSNSGFDGGAGGGSARGSDQGALPGTGTPEQGNNGGAATSNGLSGNNLGGGGGGGGDMSGSAGNGGDGAYYGDIFGNIYGDNGYFSGGGGGSTGAGNTNIGLGGAGGGGSGGIGDNGSLIIAATNGLKNTGGGGGAGGSSQNVSPGGNGGSGIVLIKY